MKNLHPFSRYGLALIMETYCISDGNAISKKHISETIELSRSKFRLKPAKTIEGNNSVLYDFCADEKGNPKKGVFLSPNVISSDKLAKNIFKASSELLNELNKDKAPIKKEAKMATTPIAGEYLSFSTNGGIGRGKPKIDIEELGYNILTTLTHCKPCLQYRIDKKGMPELYNCCIIPDLSLKDTIQFIKLFKKLQISQASANLMIGNVLKNESGKGEKLKVTYEAKRPLIFKGNFPNPPRSSALGSIALLGAIGEFAKQAEVSDLAQSVLDSLKGATIYMIKYGDAQTFTYNHHVIDLAKGGNLRKMVDAVYYSKLYNQGRRTATNTEYQKFDLFSSRFLQLFNAPAFQDFLAFRAEYSHELELLFKTYFIKMENIKPEIVTSVRFLGKWLNNVAYHAAKREIKEGSPNYHEKIREQKAKVLIELESAAFAAKSGDALVAQVVTRAGRLSGMDAPSESDVFMEATMNGELKLSQAQNLIIAFSRLKSNKASENESVAQNENEGKEELDIV
ncbi:type I-PGING CRISPR-associated protein Cas8c/Csp2 [Saccharicrinis fermentans]|nr:type I-PGING CRISPR-associated protein Cas8c/Csp2 [Saccharicrinis fermentans]